jgi:hypothetical protein
MSYAGALDYLSDLNDTEEAEILGLAANCFQVYSFMAPLLLGDPGTEEVLNAIDQLKQEMEVDFAWLGSLIVRQIRLSLANENGIALAQALAHTGTAMDHLANWARTKQDADLQFALNESDLGIQFFLALPATTDDPNEASRTQPNFLPGMAKSGTVRVLALMARDGAPLWKVEEDILEVRQIIDLLEGMIESIEANVNAAHTVVWGQQVGTADPVEWAYFHEEDGTVLQIFPAGPVATNAAEYAQEHKRIAAALSAAEAARAKGVVDELASLGIPHYQALIDTEWEIAITNPLHVIIGGTRAPMTGVHRIGRN